MNDMKFPMFWNGNINILMFFLSVLITTVVASTQSHSSNFYCLDNVGNYTTNSIYQNNLNALLPYLTNKALLTTFGNASVGEGIDQVYMLYNCRGDLNLQQCHDCINAAAHMITQECPTQREAISWYHECMLRYANRSIFSLEEESPHSWDYLSGTDPNPQLAKIVAENIEGLIEEAAYNKTTRGFATGEVNIALEDSIYFLVQCTPDILGSRCERCLRAAFRSMAGCCGTRRSTLMMFFPSCHIRYERAPFTLNGAKANKHRQNFPIMPSFPPPPNSGNILVFSAILLYIFFASFIVSRSPRQLDSFEE